MGRLRLFLKSKIYIEQEKTMTAYNKGYEARKLGKSRGENPYEYNSPEYLRWNKGWYQADQELAKEKELDIEDDFSPGL